MFGLHGENGQNNLFAEDFELAMQKRILVAVQLVPARFLFAGAVIFFDFPSGSQVDAEIGEVG